MISLIWAMARNRVIGIENRLPWHLPEDFKHFRKVTNGHPVVMGRKTHESIGRLLPGRENRIVTRNPGYRVEGARVFGSLEEACRMPSPTGEVFVLGGAEIYAQALPFADRLHVTLIERDYEGDARFPELDLSRFREASRQDHPAGPGGEPAFSFVLYERA